MATVGYGYPDHPSGQAVDIMMPQGCAATDGRRELGRQIAAFLMKYADEYRVKHDLAATDLANHRRPEAVEQWDVMGTAAAARTTTRTTCMSPSTALTRPGRLHLRLQDPRHRNAAVPTQD